MIRKQIRITGISAALSTLFLTALVQSARAEPFEMPNRKPGLWEIKVNLGAQMPAMVVQQCTDATTDKDMATSFSPMAKEMCANQDMQKTATGMVVDATCTVNGMTSVSHTEINGDFNSAYTVKVSSKNTDAPAGVPAEAVTMMEAKWAGACKADQKAGDMIMPGGVKINIKDMQALKGMLPKK
jgi:Protein of unknown function (DUF3617)